MKIAISTQGKDLSAPFHPGFGRTLGFIIYDLDTDEYSFLSNEQNITASKGAGVRAAQDVVKTGAKAIITGQIGPKAISYLQGKGMDIYLSNQKTVREAIDSFKEGKLTKI